MCEPTTILMGLSTVIGLVGSAQQMKSNQEIADVEQEEINDSSTAAKNDRMQEARAQRATARVAAAEAGVSGNSVSALLNDAMMQGGVDVSRIESNRKNSIAASAAELKGRQRSAMAGAAEQLVGGASSAYGNHQKLKIAGDA